MANLENTFQKRNVAFKARISDILSASTDLITEPVASNKLIPEIIKENVSAIKPWLLNTLFLEIKNPPDKRS